MGPKSRHPNCRISRPARRSPKFSVPLQPGSYEVRRYGPAKWVSTCVESMDWDSAIQTGFARLNSYLEGKNEKGEGNVLCNYRDPGRAP